MIAGEWLGVSGELPPLIPQFIHQSNQADVALGMASGDELAIIQPELLDLSSPRFTARNEAQLGVFPLHAGAKVGLGVHSHHTTSDQEATISGERFNEMRRLLPLLALALLLTIGGRVHAASVEVTFQRISSDGIGDVIGTATAKDTDQGLVVFPDLNGLPEGEHGFHLHSLGSCEAGSAEDGTAIAGLQAGGHWDPDESGSHQGPFGNGHRGDLSRLIVDADGSTNTSIVAPRLSTADLSGKAFIVHAGGDTYSDTPPLGGGGARIACGVVGSGR